MLDWQKKDHHDKEVRGVLKNSGCMDSGGRIRSWKKDTWEKLKDCGHTSLDCNRCECLKSE